jgi:hypothetical protein
MDPAARLEQPKQGSSAEDGTSETSAHSPAGAWDERAGSPTRRTSNRAARATAMARAGFGDSPPSERVLFGMTTSFALTVAVSRTITYVRERRQPMPRARSLGRRFAALASDNSVRVHHFLPGMAIAFTTGGIALLTRAGRLERLLSLPFGVGVALTTDELRLLAGRNNPYWGGEGFALTQGATALMASLGFCIDFVRRGHGEVAISRSTFPYGAAGR